MKILFKDFGLRNIGGKRTVYDQGKRSMHKVPRSYIITTTTIPLTQNEQSITFLVHAISNMQMREVAGMKTIFPLCPNASFIRSSLVWSIVIHNKRFQNTQKNPMCRLYNSMYNHIVYGVKLMCNQVTTWC